MDSASRTDHVEVVRSEEQLALSTTWEESGRVRISKRIVTEERLVPVTVRREELVVEDLPAQAGPGDVVASSDPALGTSVAAATPVLELVLWEEEVAISTHLVPRERVSVFVDRIEGTTHVVEDLAGEVVEVDEVDELGTTSLGV